MQKKTCQARAKELITNSIQRRLESSGETETPTKVIGELVMDSLKELDRVAYLRFASVYKDFETDDFRKFIDKNLNLKKINFVINDQFYMNIACSILERSIGSSFPNPTVICLIVRAIKNLK